MSKTVTKNSITISSNNLGKENNVINNADIVSDNFNQIYKKILSVKKTKDTNKNNNPALNKNISKNQLNIISSTELEFVYNNSQNKIEDLKKNPQISKINSKKHFNRNKKKNLSLKSYTSTQSNNTISNQKKDNIGANKISSSKNVEKIIKTTIKKTREKKILKKNNSVKIFDHFLRNVKEDQKKKETNLNNLRNQSLQKERSEMKKRPNISKKSIMLAKNRSRQPLYQLKPLNEELKLDENFHSFYTKYGRDNLKNEKMIIKTPLSLNSRTLDEKFTEFYKNNVNWKKQIEEKNNSIRKNKQNLSEESYLELYTFKPKLNRNSMNIIERLNRNRSMNFLFDNNLHDYENEKELMDKLKIRLKPIINEYFNIKKPYINKRSQYLNKCKSHLNFGKNNIICNSVNKDLEQKKKSKNFKINYKLNEKKYKKVKKENKQKKDEEKRKKKKRAKSQEYYLLVKIKGLSKDAENKKKELYKLNLRHGTAWNDDCVNNIFPRNRPGNIIEGLL